MSASSSKNKIQLGVETKDETADIYVIDSFFRVVGRGRGTSQTYQLKPGIYTVKVRVGFESCEKDVVLIDKPETATFDAVEFPSAIPLIETARTHEYHIAAAEHESRKIHLKKGEGSWIFVFARDWKPPHWKLLDLERKFETTSLPHKGLKLKGMKDEVIVDFETDKNVVSNKSLDAWAACNIELHPGQYRLSVEIESGKSVEQTVVACRGWQTQVFLLQKSYDPKKTAETRRADLTNTGILMSRGRVDEQNPLALIGESNGQHPKMFDAQNPKMKLLDLARIGLANNHQMLPDEVIDRILYGKFENPMLGILGAHLLLKGKKTRLGLLKIVVDNLRRILGEGTHPDVEALALRVENKKAKYDFDLPPMLRRSWIQVVKSTADNPGLVPLDSFACQNSERMLADEPWLLYLSNNQDTAESLEESIRHLVNSQSSGERNPLVSRLKISPTPVREQVFLSADIAVESDSTSSRKQQFVGETSDALPTDAVPEFVPRTMDDKTVKNLVSSMGLPKSKVIQILNRLEL
jgi:hypothetical protein